MGSQGLGVSWGSTSMRKRWRWPKEKTARCAALASSRTGSRILVLGLRAPGRGRSGERHRLCRAWFVQDSTSGTMLAIAANPPVMRVIILIDVLTGLGFYALEAALLAEGPIDPYALLRLSEEYACTGRVAGLLIT